MSINNQPIFLIFDLDCIIGDLYTDKYYNIIMNTINTEVKDATASKRVANALRSNAGDETLPKCDDALAITIAPTDMKIGTCQFIFAHIDR